MTMIKVEPQLACANTAHISLIYVLKSLHKVRDEQGTIKLSCIMKPMFTRIALNQSNEHNYGHPSESGSHFNKCKIDFNTVLLKLSLLVFFSVIII